MTGTGPAGTSLLGDAGCSGGGTTLSFVSENTAAIGANLGEFEKLMGIKANILQLELTSLVQNVASDTGSGLGSYQNLVPFHGATAKSTIVVAPMILVGLAVRRYLAKGLTLVAVTGE